MYLTDSADYPQRAELSGVVLECLENLRFSALVAVSRSAGKSSGYDVSNRMSPNKTPSTRRELASRYCCIDTPSYRDQSTKNCLRSDVG